MYVLPEKDEKECRSLLADKLEIKESRTIRINVSGRIHYTSGDAISALRKKREWLQSHKTNP